MTKGPAELVWGNAVQLWFEESRETEGGRVINTEGGKLTIKGSLNQKGRRENNLRSTKKIALGPQTMFWITPKSNHWILVPLRIFPEHHPNPHTTF